MTYVVTEACIKCKYMDCVEVCPVDCFYEGENMLVIHPDECIDCGVCEPECPAEAIVPDSEPVGREMGRDQPPVFDELAEYHPQGRSPGRCRPIEGRPRQVREVLQPNPGKTVAAADIDYGLCGRCMAALLVSRCFVVDLQMARGIASLPVYMGPGS